MSFQNQKNQNNWSKNWSARGTAMINKLESSSAPKAVSAPSFKERLDRLLNVQPLNPFYRSLSWQLRQGKTLSKKQLDAIFNGYKQLTVA